MKMYGLAYSDVRDLVAAEADPQERNATPARRAGHGSPPPSRSVTTGPRQRTQRLAASPTISASADTDSRHTMTLIAMIRFTWGSPSPAAAQQAGIMNTMSEATVRARPTASEMEVGNYFVANYPPFSTWTTDAMAVAAKPALATPGATDVPLGGHTRFVYRDQRWQAADLAGLGVASFGHVNGVHMQSLDSWGPYTQAIQEGRIPLNQAYRPTDEERLIRELGLQFKLGSIRPAYILAKYEVDVRERFKHQFASLATDGYLAESTGEWVRLTCEGLLRVDNLLARFFLPAHTNIRYK